MVNKYTNFVKPESLKSLNLNLKFLTGEEASKLYLEEIKETENHVRLKRKHSVSNNICPKKITTTNNLSDNNLFTIVQNNNVNMLTQVLESCPDKVNMVDEFGWSLLMIACQANSIETVEELLKHGADTGVRDRAGNSAQSLVIKNKNYILADILLNHKHKANHKNHVKQVNVRLKEKYVCDICKKTFTDREEHLSSTLHNISASRGKKITASYAIPQSNRGFQMMLKGGWDKDRGLGRHGSGKQYPIKTVQKLDKKGLGHKKNIAESRQDTVKHENKNILIKGYNYNKNFEINFRREFY